MLMETAQLSASLEVGTLKTGWITLVGNKVNTPMGISPHSFVVSFTQGGEECRILRCFLPTYTDEYQRIRPLLLYHIR